MENEEREVEDLSLRRVGKFPKLGLIKRVFAWENDIRAAIYAARNDRPRGEKLIGGGKYGGSPTENQAIANITPLKSVTLPNGFILRQPEKWINVIESTYDYFSDKLMRDAFQRGSHGQRYWHICEELHISKSSFYNIMVRGEDFAVAAACELGLISIIKSGREKIEG